MVDEVVVPNAVVVPEEILIVVMSPFGPESYLNPTNVDMNYAAKYLSFDWKCKHGHQRHLTFVGMAFTIDRGAVHTDDEIQETLNRLPVPTTKERLN